MDLAYTRAMVDHAVEGHLARVEFEKETAFGFSIPKNMPGRAIRDFEPEEFLARTKRPTTEWRRTMPALCPQLREV